MTKILATVGIIMATCLTLNAAEGKERTVRLLHIADTHAQLETHPEYMPGHTPELQMMGGFARLKTALDRLKSQSTSPVFIADSGDAFQGSGPAAWTEGEAILKPLNALGLDIFVPGNWEPVYGPERFKSLMSRMTAKVITYNFQDTATGTRLFEPAAIMERGGVKVAFIGVADPTTTQRQPPAQVRGLDSTRLEGLRDFVKTIKREQKPDLVVAVTHTGLTVSRQIAREIPELDVLLSGHTHERTEQSILEGKVIVVEPGSLGSFVGELDITLAPQGGVASHRFRLVPVTAKAFKENSDVKEIVEQSLAPHRARMERVVGRSKGTLMRYDVLETTTDNFVADAVRGITGADIAFSNGFRFGPPIKPGQVTEGDLWDVLPLDARIKVGWVTGKQLRSYLENELELVYSKDPWKLSGGWGPRASGLKMTYYAHNPPGKRLVSIKVGGEEIKDNNRYQIAGCEREGETMDFVCRMHGVADVKIHGMTVHQALLAHLAGNPDISAERDQRVAVLDLPPRVLSQDEILSAAQGFQSKTITK